MYSIKIYNHYSYIVLLCLCLLYKLKQREFNGSVTFENCSHKCVCIENGLFTMENNKYKSLLKYKTETTSKSMVALLKI